MADMIHINTEAVVAFFNELKYPCLLKPSNWQIKKVCIRMPDVHVRQGLSYRKHSV